ncbi:adhesive plaque matrix protein isoform X2 [Agrilus planipennis]|uniref:Adhesive plaque matrix protein isoform X2 n=1 Tax=Agrilus planipennis TaxID=224129 RepID=A0A1W4WYT1_AGRPL|nr:adhesive plaque matrix protein isoform X2 [Agrilus planipennis]
MQITLLVLVFVISIRQSVAVKKSSESLAKESSTNTSNSIKENGKDGKKLPGPAILAIEIVDPNEEDTAEVKREEKTKRTIESSLGYGRSGGVPKSPKFMYYKYSQHDIPSPSSHSKRSQKIKKGTQVSVVPSKSSGYSTSPTENSAAASSGHPSGTTLFTTVNSQGQLGTLSPHLTYQNLGANGPVVPVIILRIYTNQLASPNEAVYPNLPDSDPYAGLNNVNIMEIVQKYLRQIYQNPHGVNEASVNLHGARSMPSSSATYLPPEQPQPDPYQYQQQQYLQPQYDVSQLQQLQQQYQHPMYYADPALQMMMTPQYIQPDYSQAYSQFPYQPQPTYQQVQYSQPDYSNKYYQPQQQYHTNGQQYTTSGQQYTTDGQQYYLPPQSSQKYASAVLPTEENYPSKDHTRVIFHSNTSPESEKSASVGGTTDVANSAAVAKSPLLTGTSDTSPVTFSSPTASSKTKTSSKTPTSIVDYNYDGTKSSHQPSNEALQEYQSYSYNPQAYVQPSSDYSRQSYQPNSFKTEEYKTFVSKAYPTPEYASASYQASRLRNYHSTHSSGYQPSATYQTNNYQPSATYRSKSYQPSATYQSKNYQPTSYTAKEYQRPTYSAQIYPQSASNADEFQPVVYSSNGQQGVAYTSASHQSPSSKSKEYQPSSYSAQNGAEYTYDPKYYQQALEQYQNQYSSQVVNPEVSKHSDVEPDTREASYTYQAKSEATDQNKDDNTPNGSSRTNYYSSSGPSTKSKYIKSKQG